jgi:hypothetical protein
MKNWKLRYGLEWVGSMQSYDFFGLDGETDPRKLYVKDFFTHNLSGQYTWDTWSVTAGCIWPRSRHAAKTVSSSSGTPTR